MAHLAAPAPAPAADVGLALLEPELLTHALLFLEHAETVRTGTREARPWIYGDRVNRPAA